MPSNLRVLLPSPAQRAIRRRLRPHIDVDRLEARWRAARIAYPRYGALDRNPTTPAARSSKRRAGSQNGRPKNRHPV